ncbi:MAG: DUF1573 domain-containing protein [Thermoguttaceae bacterium]
MRCSTFQPRRVARLLFGMLLSAGATLKGCFLIAASFSGSNWLDRRPFLIGAVEFQDFFRRWLLVVAAHVPARSSRAAVLGCFCVVSATCAGCGKAAPPSFGLTADSQTHNFGERRQGQELSHVFTLTNPTDVPIDIVRALSSCHCVVAGKDGELPDTRILPHETMRVPVRFQTGLSGASSGRLVVFYRFETEPADAPPQRFLALELRAQVVADYRITPVEIDFGEIDGLSTQRVTRNVRITPEASKKVVVRNVRTTSGFLTARLLPASRDDFGSTVEVALDASRFSESRPCDGAVLLLTDSVQAPEAAIDVRGRYLAPATIEPAMVVIGSDDQGEVKRDLRVSSRQPSRIRCVPGRTGPVGADFDAREISREHTIRVRVAPCSQHVIESELNIDLEFLPQVGGNVVRRLTIPIHRFLRERE